MADLPGEFWSGWIIGITVLSLAALIWLVLSIYFTRDKSVEHESPVWDGNLREGSYPAPMWWFWLILVLLVFSVVYLMLFPGLGSFQGAMKWSQGGRLEKSQALYEQEFAAARAGLLAASYGQLHADPEAMRAAEGLFNRNCSACHGLAGEGQANRFPNLTDSEWQWGGDPQQIEQTIRQGRMAAMPPWQDVLGDEGVVEVTAYLLALSAGGADALPGKAKYDMFCIACHGPAAEGNAALGAPDLSNPAWLYGGSEAAIAHSIAAGRNGVMPAFGGRLDDVQIHLLVAWLTR